MAELEVYVAYTNSKARRRTFYCYCTKEFIQDQSVFFVLVEAFKKDRKKRQAAFINDWFVNGNIPEDLQEGGYLTKVNISNALATETSQATANAIKAVGATFAEKMANKGGGASGFFGALQQKMSGSTKLSASLFNQAQLQVVGMLNDRHGFGGEKGAGATYQPDSDYQPNGFFTKQVIVFKKKLKENGFDPDDLGIY
jgi:hypothetical protein